MIVQKNKNIKMKIVPSFIALFFLLCIQSCVCQEDEKMYSLWYDKPAEKWLQALPVGNGRLGMMPDGGVDKELVVLNDKTMWAGAVDDNGNPAAAKSLPKIREYLAKGDNVAAQELMYKTFVPAHLPITGSSFGNFQILGNLYLKYSYKHADAPVTAYERSLNLKKGWVETSFTKQNKFKRTYFVSRSGDVMLIHMQAEEGDLAFNAQLSRPERGKVHAEADCMVMEGSLHSGLKDVPGLSYQTKLAVAAKGGKVTYGADGCQVEGSDEAVLVISTATNYKRPSYKADVDALMDKALKADINQLKKQYSKEYSELYSRAQMRIGKGMATPEAERYWNLPTDQRLQHFQQVDDPSLAALYYSFGRYLLISSTCQGQLPANLQGLWANTIDTPWNGDYHLNINVQMNHWFAESGNLSDLHLPLIELTKGLVKSGEESAKSFYGSDANGWVAHMKTNAWNFTAPGQHPSWGATNTGGAWLCAHLWEHYLYTLDTTYLKEVYPVLKGAAAFFLSTMMVEPEHGWLVTAPSSSPENRFFAENGKDHVSVCMGPTMDNQLVRELFTNVVEAARVLNCDTDFSITLQEAIQKLPPHQISKEGYLMEWLKDYKETDVHHRHISHLYGLYPGSQISMEKTPELAEACRVTLNRREGNVGAGDIGWSLAWKMNFWARLGDAEHAYRMFKYLMSPRFDEKKREGITSENLFCSCSGKYQIDGNMGGAAGITEMLLQSQEGFIHFIPALPKAWPDGEVRGFKVRGGAVVDFAWNEGKLTDVTISGVRQCDYKILIPSYATGVIVKQGGSLKEVQGEKYLSFTLRPNEIIKLSILK